MNPKRWLKTTVALFFLLTASTLSRPGAAGEPGQTAAPELTAQQKARLEEANQLDQKMFAFYQQGKGREALEPAQQALAIRREVLGEKHADTAMAIHNVGFMKMMMGDYRGAQADFETCLPIQREVLGEKDPATINSINALGGALKMQGNFAAARPYYEKALALYKQVLGDRDLSTANALNNLGTLLQAQSEYDAALPLLQESLAIKREVAGDNTAETATALNNMGSLLDDMGDFPAAKPYFEQALAINRQVLGERHPATANCLNNLASVMKEMGDYAAALRDYETALDIDLAVFGRNHPATGLAANNMGFILEAMGDFNTAKRYFYEALDIRRKVLGERHPLTASSLSNLGLLFRLTKEYDQARTNLEQALEINQQVFGENHPATALALHNMGFLLQLQGDYPAARSYYERSLAIRQKIFGDKNVDITNSLRNMGCLLELMEDFAGARPYLEKSLALRQQLLGPDHPSTAQSHEALALLAAFTGNWAEAAAQNDATRRIYRRHFARVLPALSEQRQLEFIHEANCSMYGGLALGLRNRDNPELAATTASWLVNGKGVGQEALGQRALVSRLTKNTQTAEGVGKLAIIRRKLAKVSMTAPRPGMEKARAEMLDRLQREEFYWERQLAEGSGQTTSADPWVSLEKIRAALDPQAVLIEVAYFQDYDFDVRGNKERWLPHRYAAWIIPPAGKGDVRVVDLGDAATIDQAVEAARRTFLKPRAAGRGLAADDEENQSQAEKDFRAAPAELARLILHPLLGQIGDAKRLIISPDAALWLVAWGALPLPDGRYAIEDYSIQYLISSRELAVKKSGPTPTSKPAVMANPDFDLTPQGTLSATAKVFRKPVPKPAADQLALRSVSTETGTIGRVARLPGTAKEAAAIEPQLAKYAGDAPNVYVDRYALESVFKALDRPKAVVLSTHGFFLRDQKVAPDDSMDEDGQSEARTTMLTADGTLVENPLLRCGLLLAGCNRRGAAATGVDSELEADDGILTGMEIIGTDLRGTDLVVLSACETGLGEVHNGEGVAGLRQAFQLAGAQAVVASLWQVPDEQTAELMSLFFENLAQKQSKADALRGAQLTMLQRHAKDVASQPFYWAAFTLTGR